MITDAEGKLQARMRYLPYGEVDSGGSVEHKPVPDKYASFTGQEHDDATGLIYYNSRFYDPSLGRFVSPDSIIPGIDAVDFNRYAYVKGNPIRYSDPTGHYPIFDHGWRGSGWEVKFSEMFDYTISVDGPYKYYTGRAKIGERFLTYEAQCQAFQGHRECGSTEWFGPGNRPWGPSQGYLDYIARRDAAEAEAAARKAERAAARAAAEAAAAAAAEEARRVEEARIQREQQIAVAIGVGQSIKIAARMESRSIGQRNLNSAGQVNTSSYQSGFNGLNAPNFSSDTADFVDFADNLLGLLNRLQDTEESMDAYENNTDEEDRNMGGYAVAWTCGFFLGSSFCKKQYDSKAHRNRFDREDDGGDVCGDEIKCGDHSARTGHSTKAVNLLGQSPALRMTNSLSKFSLRPQRSLF